MRTILIAAVVALCAAVAVPAVAHKGGKKHGKGHKPDVIALPDGFQPEGITTAKRHTFFVGSRDTVLPKVWLQVRGVDPALEMRIREIARQLDGSELRSCPK